MTRGASALLVAVGLVPGTAALAVLSSCATTYDTSIASQQAATSTSSTLPAGSATDLLPRLVTEATALSGLMIANGDARGSAERIRALWDAVKVEVNSHRPDLLFDLASNVELCERAVEFRRAADADKAAKNLTALVDAYLAS